MSGITTDKAVVTECCDAPIAVDQRFCPTCGYEARLCWRWNGPGPEPAKWTASDGTLVYRSYEDYCDD